MNNNLEEHASTPPETERSATPHTAVLLPMYRKDTGLSSGRVASKGALRQPAIGFVFPDVACRDNIRLGNEFPFYEVAYRGKVYRVLSRLASCQESGLKAEVEQFELIRTWAPGLQCDGWFMDAPQTVPNTPRALAEEISSILGAGLEDVLTEAYSIFHYRLEHAGRFPESMEPTGWTFREVFLMSLNAGGTLRTLYETPVGTNVESWTMFLRILDTNNPKLASYVTSEFATREFGTAGVAAMREALLLRYGNVSLAAPKMHMRFLEAFPLTDYIKRSRNVSVNTSWL